jgi:hypothetical protein
MSFTYTSSDQGRRIEQSVFLPLPLLSPSAQWNGTVGSGFGTANPAAPTDPTRTTAKPAVRLITPSHQWFTDTLDVGVAAMANENGMLTNAFGIANVKFYYEGNAVTVATPRWHLIKTERGPRIYYGWWVRLKKVIGTVGTGNLYVEATARDSTMQKRVLGPVPFSPRDTLYDAEIEINPDLSVITGQRYQSFAPAILWANQQNRHNPRFLVTKAGRYELQSTEISGVVNRWDNTGRYTIEATVPITLGRSAYVDDGAQIINAQRTWWRLKGTNITFDNRYGQSWAASGPAGTAQALMWLDGINLTNTSPDGKFELVRGMRWTEYGLPKRGSWYTEVEASEVYVPYRAASLVRGCSGIEISGDSISDSLCVVQSTFRANDSFEFNLDRAAFSMVYSGAEATATVSRSGGNLGSSNGGLWTVVIGATTYTFDVGNGSNAYYLGPPAVTYRGASGLGGYWVSDVVDWLNTLPGVTATLSTELAATDRAAAALSMAGLKGVGFTNVNFKTTPAQIVWNADEHGDWYQLNSSDLTNAIIAFNTAYDMDGQMIFLSPNPASRVIHDVFFAGNTLAMKRELESNYFSQFGRANAFSHVVIAANTLINQSFLIDDRPGESTFTGGYNAIIGNVMRGLGWRVDGAGVTGLMIERNLFHAGAIPPDTLYSLAAGDEDTLVEDFEAGDFTPLAALKAEGFDRIIPTDKNRASFPAVAAVGAIAAPAVVGKTFAPAFVSSTITGTAEDGQVLTAAFAATGLPAVTLAYQWRKNGTNIAGQTARTITLNEASMGLAQADEISCVGVATNGVGSPATVTATRLYRPTLIDQLKASPAVRAVYEWDRPSTMTAGDSGPVVQGDGDTIAVVPNAKTPGTNDAVQATATARPIYNNGAVFDGTDDFLRIPFAAGTAPGSTTIVCVLKTSDTVFMLAGTNSASHFAGAAESGLTSSPHLGSQGSPTYRVGGTLVSPVQRGALRTAAATGNAVVVRISAANFSSASVTDIRNAYATGGFFLSGVWMPIAIIDGSNADAANAITNAEAEAARIITALGL